MNFRQDAIDGQVNRRLVFACLSAAKSVQVISGEVEATLSPVELSEAYARDAQMGFLFAIAQNLSGIRLALLPSYPVVTSPLTPEDVDSFKVAIFGDNYPEVT